MFSDLLVGIVSVFIDILQRITITWHAGNFGCKLIRYLQVCRPTVEAHSRRFSIY